MTADRTPVLLLVNDDGIGSPMLGPLARTLARLGEVRIAVPATEQSWTGKAMTRFRKLSARRIEADTHPELANYPTFAIDGAPSDCANLGIHTLFDSPPDWVVSGINLGSNAGLNFLLNSGTVGAAIEAALCGVPAIALSQRLSREMYGEWMRSRQLASAEARHLIEMAAERSASIVQTVMERGLPEGAEVLNVNFPIGMDSDTPARWVPVLTNRYGSLFSADADGGYRHAGTQGDTWRDDSHPADRTVVEDGQIAITPLTLSKLSVPVSAPYPL